MPHRAEKIKLKTLIELFDERPLENVLAAEVFRPERVVFLAADSKAQDKSLHARLRQYFARRGMTPELIFLECSRYNAAKIERQLRRVAELYPDCALDITGGTDAALFAAGLLCADTEIPVFTFSRRQGRFYDIRRAEFAEEQPRGLRYTPEDFFLMAGGSMREGRFDSGGLDAYMGRVEPFFALYMRHRRRWSDIVAYFQRLSHAPAGEPAPLDVRGAYTVKAERGSRVSADEDALRELQQLGFISGLRIERGERVSFRFADGNIRTWLRDAGSVLELYTYKQCLDSRLFDDVRISAVVDWDGSRGRDAITNELDVTATRGICPVFISCKTCSVSTEAINELAVLRDRFGGKMACAAIVSTEKCSAAARHRAAELDITVIDLEDVRAGRITTRLRAMTEEIKK